MKEKVASLSHLMERLWWGTLDPSSASLGSRDKGYSELGAGHSPPHFLPHGWWGRFVFLKDWAISPADRYNTQWSCSIRGDVVSGGCPGQLKMARVGDTSRLVLKHMRDTILCLLGFQKKLEILRADGQEPGRSVVKNLPANAGDTGSIPGSGRSPGGGNGDPLQYSCLDNAHGQRSLLGYSPQARKESDMTEHAWHSGVELTDKAQDAPLSLNFW